MFIIVFGASRLSLFSERDSSRLKKDLIPSPQFLKLSTVWAFNPICKCVLNE